MKKILIVDDTKNIRSLLTTCLEIEGFKVSTACDGREALEMFKKEKFDMAFLDVKMPEISGTEVLRRIRDMDIQIPIIIITAFATVKNAIECTKLGAVAYLQKPFTAEKIRLLLKELLEAEEVNSDNCEMEGRIIQINALIGKGRFSEALNALKKAISDEPANPELFMLFSKAYNGLGKFNQSEKFYKAYELFKDK